MKRILPAFAGMLLAWPVGAQSPAVPKPIAAEAVSAVETYRAHCTEVVTRQWLQRFDVTNALGPAFIEIRFQVSPEGRAKHIEVVTATNGAVTLRRTVLAAAEASRFTPMPVETAKELGNRPLQVKMEFALRTK